VTESARHTLEVRLHLTNVTGTGAAQLLKSLLPALQRQPATHVAEIYLPDRGDLASYVPDAQHGPAQRYRRILPNALSRVLECTALARRFSGTTPLLVFGDLPLRCEGTQVVFVQKPHLGRGTDAGALKSALKSAFSRFIFDLNVRYADAIIVQTSVMRDLIERSYPAVVGKVQVIAQPVPSWLLEANLHRTGPARPMGNKLQLFYPAASYPHKNHSLLSRLSPLDANAWPIEQLLLTVPPETSPAPSVPWVKCVGLQPSAEIIRLYRSVDALVFLSTEESYGFPLVEAMSVGIPIICPDLPYAHALCGEGAIYFNPRVIESLGTAIKQLHDRLAHGWWPDWSAQLTAIPPDWDSVAAAMLEVVRHASRTRTSTGGQGG
jgi:hypothetical protein